MKAKEVKWTLTSSQALQVANYRARRELSRQREGLVNKAFHVSLSGSKRNPFTQEIEKVDRHIRQLQLGAEKAAAALPNLTQRMKAFSMKTGIPIVSVKRTK